MFGDWTGNLTFLFTDVEGSTRIWETRPECMRAALVRHDDLLRRAIEAHGGRVFKTMGDGFFAVFPEPVGAVRAASHAQGQLVREDWSEVPGFRVRMALHTGSAEARDGDYFGPSVNRVARLLDAAHGGQILLSGPVADALGAELPADCRIRPLGRFRFRDLAEPERVFQLDPPDLPGDFPPLRALAAFPHNLPVQLSSFVGRDRELDELATWLPAARLITLTGPGGAGKTRLALQLGSEVSTDFTDGVWLIELAPVHEPAQVPRALSAALGLREDPARPLLSTLHEYLQHRHTLVIFDNCEHLLDSVARLAQDLLIHCPGVRVLATSREALRISGERLYPVPPLTLPGPEALHLAPADRVSALEQFEAVRLFCERARAVRPGFELTPENSPAVVALCSQLDGLPLAIELAAARVKVFTPEQLVDRLQDRFRLLMTGTRTAEPRQRTLRGAIDWSFDLLSPTEQRLFARLGVFAGSFDLAAAETICADDESPDLIEDLESLVEKSLLVSEEVHDQSRYRLLETLRAYALDKLGTGPDAETLQQAHAHHYTAVAQREGECLEGERGDLHVAAVQRLDQDLDNFRVALGWTLEREPEVALRMVRGLGLYWLRRGRWSEASEAHDRALALGVHAPAALRAKVMRRAGVFAQIQGDYRRAHALSGEALSLYTELDDPLGIAVSLFSLGTIASSRGDTQEAWSYYEETLSQFRAIGRNAGIADCHQALGTLALAGGDLWVARDHFERCLSLHQELKQATGVAIAQNLLGTVAQLEGKTERAEQLYQQALDTLGPSGDRVTSAVIYQNRGRAFRSRGDLVAARRHLELALSIAREIGSRELVAVIRADAALVDLAEGSTDPAQKTLAECLTVLRRLGSRRHLADIVHACALGCLLEERLREAGEYFAEALRLRQEMQNLLALPESLEGAAFLAIQLDRPEEAARFLGAAEALRGSLGLPHPPAECERLSTARDRLRERLGSAALDGEWQRGGRLARETSLQEALTLLDSTSRPGFAA